MEDVKYAGFWIRTGASLIDTLLMLIIILPVMHIIYGTEYWMSESLIAGFWDLFFSYLMPAIAIIVFWVYKSATPGKMALNLSIVDAKTGNPASIRQLIIRYLSYYLSLLSLCLGFIWVGIDKKKQGFHDKISGTIVLKNLSVEKAAIEQQA